MSVNWRTVSEQIDHAAVGAFCAEQWGGEPDSLRLVNLGINAVYRFTSNGDGYYLRLSHLTMRPLDEWTAATDYLVHLAQHEVPVCRPVRSYGGQWIEAMHQDGLEFWGTVVTEAPGDLMHVDHADLRVYEAWGRSLGLLHRAARDYAPDPALPFKTIDSIWHNVTPTAHNAADDEIRAAFETISAWWADLPRHDFGLTHADHRPGNVIWDGTTARIVDFDEPVYHWFVSDIARAMLAFSDQPLERRIAVRDAFLRGYRVVTDLDPVWVELLPEFMQWRGLLMHLWDLQFVSGGNFDAPDPMIRHWAVTRLAF